MADFDKYATLLIQLEGGYCWHPLDSGGPTNMGVTLKVYQKWYGKDKTAEDLRKMNYARWKAIMKTDYWDKCSADRILSQSVAELFVDWCINGGTGHIKDVQRIVGTFPDGIVGPKTLTAINARTPKTLWEEIWAARKANYSAIVNKKPSQRVFWNGWMNRLAKFHFVS